MRSRFSKLAVVAVLASSLPAIAAARDCDHDRDHDHDRDREGRWEHAYVPPYAPPAAYPAPYSPRHAPYRWREASWRAREIAQLRAEFRELDRRRAEFYGYPRRPRAIRRFERWYASRRAELEHRWNELHSRHAHYAWR